MDWGVVPRSTPWMWADRPQSSSDRWPWELLLAPPPDAIAELVIELVPTVTLLATFTAIASGCAFVPGVMTWLYLQVTTCATAEHDQKFPIPDTNDKPVGSVSVTVGVPTVGPAAALLAIEMV